MAKRMKDLEDKSDVFWYYASVLNPLSYLDSFILDPSEEKVKTKAEHAAVGYALYSIPTHAAWMLSGGGATHTAARGARPGWLIAQASKKHIQSTVVQAAYQSARPVLAPAAAVAGMYYGVRSYFHHLASLDWVPDLYII